MICVIEVLDVYICKHPTLFLDFLSVFFVLIPIGRRNLTSTL